jgi:hypothetical protein
VQARLSLADSLAAKSQSEPLGTIAIAGAGVFLAESGAGTEACRIASIRRQPRRVRPRDWRGTSLARVGLLLALLSLCRGFLSPLVQDDLVSGQQHI